MVGAASAGDTRAVLTDLQTRRYILQEGPETAGARRDTPQDGFRAVGDNRSAAPDARDEQTLVRAAKAGDREAIGMLFDLHYIPVFRFLFVRTGRQEDAEDLAQEVFIRMIAALDRYQERGVPFRAWLMQIAANLARDFYRRRGARPVAASIDAPGFDLPADDDPQEMAETALTLRDVIAALDGLTPAEREVIELRFGADLSVAETAATLGKTENTVKQLTFKALNKLRKALR